MSTFILFMSTLRISSLSLANHRSYLLLCAENMVSSLIAGNAASHLLRFCANWLKRLQSLFYSQWRDTLREMQFKGKRTCLVTNRF